MESDHQGTNSQHQEMNSPSQHTDSDRQDYLAMITKLQPAQAIAILTDRLNHVKLLNTGLADWLQARRGIERTYAQNLQQLSTRPFTEEKLDLGVFGAPLQKLRKTLTSQLADSHKSFAHKIEQEIERHLRKFLTSEELYRDLSPKVISNLQQTVKEIEDAQRKVSKLGPKDPAQKVANAVSELERAQESWASEAPSVFESLQKLDEERWSYIKKHLTHLDACAEDMTSYNSKAIAESLSVLLNVQAVDEIQKYAVRAPAAMPVPIIARERRMSQATLSPNLSASASQQPPPPPVPALPRDYDNQPSNSSPEKSKKDSLLSRFRSVVGGSRKNKRQSTHPYGHPVDPSDSQTSSAPNPSRSFFGRRNEQNDDTTDTLSLAPPTRSVLKPSDSRASFTPATQSSFSVQPLPPSIAPSSASGDNLPDIAWVSDARFGSSNGVSNTATIGSPEFAALIEPGKATPPHEASDTIQKALQEAALVSDTPSNHLVVEIKNAPIRDEDEGATVALTNVASTLRAQATPRRNNTIRGRRENRNTILVPSTPITNLPFPSVPASSSAPNSPKLVSAVPVIPSLPPASMLSQPAITPPNQHSFSKPFHRSILGSDEAASDTHSVRSGRSLGSSVSSNPQHPNLHRPGLSASIIETVNVSFLEGNVSDASQEGEIALAFNAMEDQSAEGRVDSSSSTIRLRNFGLLKDVQPDVSFIDAIQGNEGKYAVNLAKLPKTRVAFTYKTGLDPSDFEKIAPIRLKSEWAVTSDEVTCGVSYFFNSAFFDNVAFAPALSLSKTPSITISNLAMIINFDPNGCVIGSCHASLGGIYSKARNVVYWRLGDVTVAAESKRKFLIKLLAPNAAGQIKPGKVEVRWEIPGATLLNAVGVEKLVSAEVEAGTEAQQSKVQLDPFADGVDEADESGPQIEDNWVEVAALRKLRSGEYVAADAKPIANEGKLES